MRKRRIHARTLSPARAEGNSSARLSAPPLLQRQADTSGTRAIPAVKSGHVNHSAQHAVAGIVPEGGRESAAALQVVPPGESVAPPAGQRLLCFLYPDGTGVKFSPAIGPIYLSSPDADGEFGPLKKRAEPLLARYKKSSITPAAQTPVSRSADGNGVPSGNSSAVRHALQSSTSRPLPSSSRRRLESSFGSDLGQVRIHTDASADRAAQSVQAKAFTTGQDVFFRSGEFQPSSRSGERLLGHEVAHTVQQAGPIARKADPDELQISRPQDPLEKEADHAAEKALAGMPARIQPLEQGQTIAREVVAPAQVPARDPFTPSRNPEPDRMPTTAPAVEGPGEPASLPAQSLPAVSETKSLSEGTASDTQAAPPSEVRETPAEVSSGAGVAARGMSEEASPSSSQTREETETAERAEAASPDQAISAVRNRAAGLSAHSPADVPVAFAQAASIQPETEKSRGAAAATVGNLDAATEGTSDVRRDDFKEKLKAAIQAATPEPKSESEAEHIMETGAQTASQTLRGSLAAEQNAAVGPLQSATGAEVSPSTQASPPETDLELEPVGPPPAPVSAELVVPPPLPPERLDYSSDRQSADNQLADNNITEEQLARGNEPDFGTTLEARGEAETHEASAEARYRQSEANLQDQAQGAAQETLGQGLGALQGSRALQIGQVAGQQMGTMGKEAAERQRITEEINALKDKTKADVDSILNEMESQAIRLFEAGLKRAETAYEDAFEEAKGGVGTWLTTWGSDWERHIETSLATARRKYLAEVDKAIDEVANCVDQKLNEARQRVTDGRKEVEAFVAGLDDSVKKFGEEALQAVQSEFDAMGSEIDQRADALVNKLTEQYKSSHERMSAREEQLRAENKSLWQRVYDATVGVVEQILAFKNMLLNVLARAAEAIELIIADPIGFLGNLVEGVKRGIEGFVSNIGTHLKNGFFEWLFGTLAAAGLKIPAQFDLKGILDLVLQVLGLTYANFRKRAVNIVGEEIVSRIEQVSEIFKILITEGPAGLWNYIKEQVSGMISALIDGIKSFLIEKVIVAGVTWIVGLLNPASAFFKACKAIYDIVMFFVERGRQILALVNAVIDSITAIAKGSLSGAAQFVENALAKGIPVAIGFLASLLGLGGLSDKIRELIEKIQAPVNKAIDWVIHKAVALVKKAGQLLGFGEEEEGQEPEAATDLKAKAGQLLTSRLQNVTSAEDVQSAVNSVLSQLKPEGLKAIELEPYSDRPGKFRVHAIASPRAEVAEFELAVGLKLSDLDLGWGTALHADLNGENLGRFEASETRDRHAEEQLLEQKLFPLARGPLENRHYRLTININRSPCPRCAGLLAAWLTFIQGKSAHPDYRFEMIINSLSLHKPQNRDIPASMALWELGEAGAEFNVIEVVQIMEEKGVPIDMVDQKTRNTLQRRVNELKQVLDDVKKVTAET